MTRIAPFIVVATIVCASCAQPDPPRPADAVLHESPVPVAQPPAAAPAASPAPRIVFLGDSLTAGYGLDKEAAVPALIQKRLEERGYDFEVVNAGVSGDTSAGGLSRLDWSLEGDVRILVIELGGNDGLRGLPVDNLKRNLTEIIRRAKSRGVTVVLTGMEAPPNFGASYTSEFRAAFKQLAHEHEVTFVPFYLEGVAGIAELNLEDGIHPNEKGSRIIEETMWTALEPLLAQAAAGRKSPTR